VSASETQECPFCAETIKAAAVLCRFCGRDLPLPRTSPTLAPLGTSVPREEPLGSAPRFHQSETFDLLTALVEKSLVLYEEDEHGQGRYRLPETVRQYARDRLLESGETEIVRGRHLGFCVELGEKAEPHLRSREQLQWLDRLESEHDNVRAALGWSLESDAEVGSRLAAVLPWFWFFRGYWREGSQWLEALLTRADGGEGTRASMLVARAVLAYSQGDLVSCDASLQECICLARATADRRSLAMALSFAGTVAIGRQEHERATAVLLESLALAREVNDRWLQAWVLVNRGSMSFLDEDQAQADQYWSEGLLLAEAVGDRFLLGVLVADLGELALYRHEFVRARAFLKRGLMLILELGQKALVAPFLEAIAAVIGATGQPRLGVQLAGAAAALRETQLYPVEALDQRHYQLRITMARADLGAATFAAAWAEGQAMSLEQAIRCALEESDAD
jgi:hypothetical protein